MTKRRAGVRDICYRAARQRRCRLPADATHTSTAVHCGDGSAESPARRGRLEQPRSRRVAQAYSTDSRWRNRAESFVGRAAIEAFLIRKWQREIDYRLIKEVWTHEHNRIAVRFAYEWRDDSHHWFRSHGNENWEFDGTA